MPVHSHPIQSDRLTGSSSPTMVLSARTSPSKLVKVARCYELERNLALSESRELRRKLADISNQQGEESEPDGPPAKRSRTASDKGHSDDDDDDAEEATNIGNLVVNAGREFVMLYCPWLRRGEATFKIEPFLEADRSERFENSDNKANWQRLEILKVLGPQLSGELSCEPWIGKAFLKGMNSQRSNTATRLRHHCAALFGASDSDMLRSEVRKEKYRHRIGWVVNEQGVGSYSSMDVEVLHKDFKGSYDIQTIFLNPILMWVFVAIIRGPIAAKELMNGISTNPRAETMAQIHGIRYTSPGAIAGAAVLARWTLSSDDFLQNVGNNTGINYMRDFEEYLEVLETGLRKRKKSVLNIFKEWDRVVFPNSDTNLIGKDQDTSSALKTAMEILDADETESEEEEEDSDEEKDQLLEEA